MILFFDTETTGFPKNWKAPVTDLDNWPRLVQLAYLVYDFEGNLLHSCNEIIKPNGFSIPIGASKVHSISAEIANQRGTKIEDVFEIFLIHLKRAKVIVAHNMAYDEKIVGSELIRLGVENILDQKERVCTMESTVNLCKIDGPYGYKWPKLEELHRYLFSCDFEVKHNILADIEATAKCFWELNKMGLLPKISSYFLNQFSEEEFVNNVKYQEEKIEIYPYRKKGNYSPFIYVNNKKVPPFLKDGKPIGFDLAFPFDGDLAIVKSYVWYGVINKKGEIIIDPSQNTRISKKPKILCNLIVACKLSYNDETDYFGVFNEKGEVIVPFEFSKIDLDTRGYIKVEGYSNNMGYSKLGYFKGIYDFKGNEVLVTIFDDIGFPSEGLCAVKLNDKWGYKNLKGDTIIEYQYTFAGEFRNGIAPVSDSPFFDVENQFNDGIGFIDKCGETIIPLKHTIFSDEVIRENGYFRLIIDGWYNEALFSENGNRITPENAYLTVLPNIIEKSDLLPFKVYNDWDETNGMAEDGLGMNRFCGYTNVDGEIIIAENYKRCDLFSEGLALVVNLNNEILFIDQTGNVIINTGVFAENPSAIQCNGFKNDVVIIDYFNKFYVLQRNGKFILENFSDSKINSTLILNCFFLLKKGPYASMELDTAVSNNYDIGIIDQNGKVIIPLIHRFLSIVKFNEYLIIASRENHYGIIDFEDNVILDFEFDYIDCRKKIALKDNIWYLIDNNGLIVGDFKFIDLLKIKSPYNYQIDKKFLEKDDFIDTDNLNIDQKGWYYIKQGEEILVLDNKFNPFFDVNQIEI